MIVPTNYVLFTISAIVSAVIFYRELWNMGPVDIFTFLIGCALSFVGVYLLTYNANYYNKQQPPAPATPPPPSESTDKKDGSENDPLLSADAKDKKKDTFAECERVFKECMPCCFPDAKLEMVQPQSKVEYKQTEEDTTVLQQKAANRRMDRHQTLALRDITTALEVDGMSNTAASSRREPRSNSVLN